MRKRFEQQLTLGGLLIEDTDINLKDRTPINELLAALKEIYCNKVYNERIFSLLEEHLLKDKKATGRTGMNLWTVFVLSQVRLCSNISYDTLHNLANNHDGMRQVMGVASGLGHPKQKFEFQNIYDNVSMLSEELISDINAVILEFGHKEVFKKKEKAALHLKTDSFVAKSNVHFPTDYNLLFDCIRKSLSIIAKLQKKYGQIAGWRKTKNWLAELKGLMRELGKSSASGGKNKAERLKLATKNYLNKAVLLLAKLKETENTFPACDATTIALLLDLAHYNKLLAKHIDLVERRLLKGEVIPHEEKIFSIFETYTEWITKGKKNPSVELGKNVAITTDQHHLIVQYRVMDGEKDREILMPICDELCKKYEVESWSVDKGFYNKENKAYLETKVRQAIMPKLGKRNTQEEEEEHKPMFKKLKNKHSAIESNINELEHRGLDRCPDSGYTHFKKYIGLAVCAYNLKKIGRKLIKDKKAQALKALIRKQAA